MIDRRTEKIVLDTLESNSTVALTGPRQVGKTTLAINIAKKGPSIYLDLEDKLDLQRIGDIKAFHKENRDKLIILDEIQRLPEIFPELRGIIDAERRRENRNGLFLFLGSASVELLQQSSESLAGRIAYVELFPVTIVEYDDINTLWLRGGFPESLLAKNDKNSLSWRHNFIRTYLERDIPLFGPRIPAETLGRFWTMLAHNQGTVLNASQLAKSLEVSATTIARYLDLMVDLLLVRRLRPWISNEGKRLVRSPKVYIRDSGITHALLNIGTYNDLLGHPVVGGSWEGFVIENILSVTPQNASAYYYRSAGGAEIDLILEFGKSETWAIEIKRSSTPGLSKGFHIGCDNIKATRKFALYSGEKTFSMKNNITAISLQDMMQEIIKNA